jgi:hypothetical protein
MNARTITNDSNLTDGTKKHILPNGTFEQWTVFLDGGGYSLVSGKKEQVKFFV